LPWQPSPDRLAKDAPPGVSYCIPSDVGQTMYRMAANTASHDSPSRPAWQSQLRQLVNPVVKHGAKHAHHKGHVQHHCRWAELDSRCRQAPAYVCSLAAWSLTPRPSTVSVYHFANANSIMVAPPCVKIPRQRQACGARSRPDTASPPPLLPAPTPLLVRRRMSVQ